jgi:hypothetical protein
METVVEGGSQNVTDPIKCAKLCTISIANSITPGQLTP